MGRRKINLLTTVSSGITHHFEFLPLLLRGLRSATRNTFLLVCLFMFSLVVGPQAHQQTPLTTWAKLDIFEDLRNESTQRGHVNHRIHQLRLNFLANHKIKDQQLKEDFHHAGLSHLLALSGGQTAPAAAFLTYLSLLAVVYVLGLMPSANLHRRHRYLCAGAYAVHSSVLIFLVGLFQSTGALARTFSQHVTMGLSAAARWAPPHASSSPHWVRPLTLATPWCLGWILHHNPFFDLSFLLSALGSLAALAVHLLFHTILAQGIHPHHSAIASAEPTFSQKVAPWLMKRSSEICCMSITSALMCLLTWPLWPPTDILPKVFANILAGPCVLFLVTPASLIVSLGQAFLPVPLMEFTQDVFDLGLSLLNAIAETFSRHGSGRINQPPDPWPTACCWTDAVPPSLALAYETLALTFVVEIFIITRKNIAAGVRSQEQQRRIDDIHTAHS